MTARNARNSGLTHPFFLSRDEQYEYVELIEIVQNISGIERIANRAEILLDKDLLQFTTRLRHLLMKDKDAQDKMREDVERNDEHRTGPGC